MKIRFLAPTMVVALALLWGVTDTAARSPNDEPPSLHVLVATSELIVVGRIVRTTQVERQNDLTDVSYNNDSRYAAVIGSIEIEETIKGQAAGKLVKLNYPKRARVTGEPVYDPDQDGVWLLRKSDRPHEYLADEVGRFQPREQKERIKAILAASRPMSQPK